MVFNQDGDCLAATLRPGNVRCVDGRDEVLLPVIDRVQARLPAHDVLERAMEALLTRSRGRSSHAPLVRYRSFSYQAASWDRPRRVIAKVEPHLGELFPRVGFLVATLTGANRAVAHSGSSRPAGA